MIPPPPSLLRYTQTNLICKAVAISKLSFFILLKYCHSFRQKGSNTISKVSCQTVTNEKKCNSVYLLERKTLSSKSQSNPICTIENKLCQTIFEMF